MSRFALAVQEVQTQRALKEVTRTFRRHPLHRRIRWSVTKVACALLTNGQHWFAPPEPRYPGSPRTHRRCRVCGGRLLSPSAPGEVTWKGSWADRATR